MSLERQRERRKPATVRGPAARRATSPHDAVAAGREVLSKEIRGLEAVRDRLGTSFQQAVEMIASCQGRVVVSGVGKSGIVAKKIAATLTSTGTQSLYLHPVEAAHGDMGILSPEDVLLLVSYSGGNDEFEDLIGAVRNLNVPILTLTGQIQSRWAKLSDVVIDCRVPEEACPMNLAPTASTTASLAMGDALAVALLERKGIPAEELARVHPSGILGRRLRLKVEDVMHRDQELPRVRMGTSLREALMEMMQKRLGCVFVENRQGVLSGIITDGDLKRILVRGVDDLESAVDELMVPQPKCVPGGALVVQALRQMEENPGGAITQLAVVNSTGCLVGAIHMHDIVRLGLAESGPERGPQAL